MPPSNDDGKDEEEFVDPGDKGDDTSDLDDEGEADDDEDDKGDKPLGPAGEKALFAEREKVRTLKKALREATAAAAKDKDGDAGEDAEKKAAEKWKPRVVNSSARAALLEAGAEKPERLLKLLDHDELEVTDRGTVDGLDEEVDRLKEEYPELFTRRRSGRRVETGDRSAGDGAKKKLSATERQARQLAGKG